MGAASPQQIDVNFHINVGVNGEKSKTIKASIDKNNPSAVINISTLNSETTDSEISQISQTKQNDRNSQISQISQNDRISQISQINPNVKDSQNFENNGNNVDPAPPMSMASSQQSSIKTSSNEQFNINHGGDNRNQNENKTKNFTKPTNGNININEGGNRRVDENGTPNETTNGNININEGGNRRVDENETPNETTNGNININEGGNRRVDENETPYSKPRNTVDIGYGDDDLGLSRKIYVYDDTNVINTKKEMINKRVEEGYFPLFIQLDKEKPLFLFIKNNETMQNVLEEYKNLKDINDDNKEYTLYNKGTKEKIPQNVPIKDLGLKYFSFISNNK
jgi:hypothetical protein